MIPQTKYSITVFTPIYNRAHLIDRLYESLLAQEYRDFEWVIINDGSTDNTDEKIKEIIRKNNKFNIVYKEKNNEGKHAAINDAVKIAQGRLFFIVDSDDYLTKDALFCLERWEKTIAEELHYAGVSGLKKHENDKVVGRFPFGGRKSGHVDASHLDRKKRQLDGDKAEAYYTHILKKYPFPVFEGETFMSESVVWNKIACDGYIIRWFPHAIYICEYLEDGLSANARANAKKNPRGVRLLSNMNSRIQRNWIDRVKYCGKYFGYSKFLTIPFMQIFRESENPCLLLFSLPIGFYYYIRTFRV